MVKSLSHSGSCDRLADASDLDRLYREQAPKMWRALAVYAGDREIAEDAVAEAFAQVLRRGGAVRSPERWVWKSAYRIAAGELQRRSRQVPLMVDPPLVSSEPAWELRAALGELPSQQRAAVVLHYYAGYQARDIARITGSTAAGVWVALSRGRSRLRALLEVSDD